MEVNDKTYGIKIEIETSLQTKLQLKTYFISIVFHFNSVTKYIN